ncbi:uncharacterized protein LOC130674445 [Microplitis mediator]|uniref:uncharacterized protein LOC130674445 n=1 Tax=Microplitis mediator TaxID=375433 RepID=UPI00255551A6|nr:uncharacterized protein LOC130674445 [Microplitis mediator]
MSGNESDENDDKPYVVILFLPRKTPETEEIEIVPSSWLTTNNKHCRYPSSSDYQNVGNWAKELKNFSDTWQLYDIEILSYAKNWKQAKRRLKRACTSKDIKSTDDETQKSDNRAMLSNKKINEALNAVPKVTSSRPISSLSNHTIVEEEEPASTTVSADKSSLESDIQPAAISGSNLRQLMDALDRKEKAAIAEIDPLLQPLQKYIELLIRKQTLSLRNYIDSSKRSLMYDLSKNKNRLQNQIIIANSHNKSPLPISSLVEIKKKFDESFPISDLETFKKFDDSLISEDHKEKNENFLNLIRVCTFGQIKVVDCVHKIFPAILKKEVELNYSGTGKKTRGVGKLNFSSTNTFKCMETVIREKFPDQPEAVKLRTLVGTWLAGAPDRDRGRASRMHQAQ